MTGRAIRRLAVAAMGMGSLLGLAGVAAPSQAAAVAAPVLTGLEKVQSEVMPSDVNSVSPKSALAKCPAGKKVVGGGGWTFETSTTAPERLTLTQLQPMDNVGDGHGSDGYRVTAAETAPGVSGNWWVQAYAWCADASSVPGWHINAAYDGGTTSDPQEQVEVGCDDPSRQRVVGTGAMIGGVADESQGQVVLQTARASGTGDIARAQSHEDATGYGGNHWLAVYAVCMDTPQGYEVVSDPSAQQDSETYKHAVVQCPDGRAPVNAGAGISTSAPGHVSLQKVFPGSQAEAGAVENTPTGQDWDYIVAQGICVDTA
ncbi:hypothetical protein SAMN04489712_1224 [Thermomonospora echinospora]|uniref:Secreted protein n=1 Tax=Thermomonospora echinospora TaxID=1992 RepID=A0A1H6DTR7_9ACTN|nr:hypothetical protein [Thermomonospora echinospora]SEG88444.1 hypothetical protein SAMN04489712_1224 [Thermomonospora echinospora]